MTIANLVIDNKSGRKIRAEVQYNEGSKSLKIILVDKVDTIYVDANPNKTLNIPIRWILDMATTEEGDVSIDDAKSEQ